MSDKRFAPSTQRNRDPILAVLRRILPKRGRLLEIASGTGEHAAFFAPFFPDLIWQPSEIASDHLASIAAWVEEAGVTNLRPPLQVDVAAPWPVKSLDAIFNANMIHISPWDTAIGLMAGAGKHLVPGGFLVLYGPFRIGGVHVSDGNANFDVSLRTQNERWGVRDLEDVIALAMANGLTHVETVEMPANNRTVVFQRSER